MGIYQFQAKDYQGRNISLGEYQGQVLLIVNTATHCGFTPQYQELEKLYQKFLGKGFEILDFPCNQFANQAPEDSGEIHRICQLKYQTSFQQFEKIEVNGANTHPLYVYLKSAKHGFLSNQIKWNFTKFLVDQEGKVIKRYAPTTSISKIEKDIVNLLKNN